MSAWEVALGEQPVGHLMTNRLGQLRFQEEAAWRAAGRRPTLAVVWSQRGAFRAAPSGLPAWFDNLLPERSSALRERLARAFSLRESDARGLWSDLEVPPSMEAALREHWNRVPLCQQVGPLPRRS